MPLIAYPCECGQVTKKYVKVAKDAAAFITCTCGKETKKGFGSTSSNHLVKIDNGLMARSIEISPDIMEVNDERSQKDFSEED